jgi:diadenosine tetraphosphate (Ap4A) HIT family hydrolase
MQYYLGAARSDEQRMKMERLASERVCLFCKAHLVEKNNPVEYDNGGWSVAKNDFPYPGSVISMLLISNRHVASPDELTAGEWMRFGDAIAWLNHNYNIKGASLLMRYGEMEFNGSSIQHLHAHVVVGIKHDPSDPGQESLKIRIGTKKT